MEIGDKIKVITTGGIGTIIDKGYDVNTWYRTDVDGIREEHELIKIPELKKRSIKNKIIETFIFLIVFISVVFIFTWVANNAVSI